ncbi:MAG TPA: hypothetical protein VMZ30_05870 [Pyrinomonadaceae bacterium]|nr:hypothetical protein [Pyrinomonadaceae bacterium]
MRNVGDETAQEGAKVEGLMNQRATSVRNHCLSPARARVAIDAPLGPANDAQMFPELPSFEAEVKLRIYCTKVPVNTLVLVSPFRLLMQGTAQLAAHQG